MNGGPGCWSVPVAYEYTKSQSVCICMHVHYDYMTQGSFIFLSSVLHGNKVNEKLLAAWKNALKRGRACSWNAVTNDSV